MAMVGKALIMSKLDLDQIRAKQQNFVLEKLSCPHSNDGMIDLGGITIRKVLLLNNIKLILKIHQNKLKTKLKLKIRLFSGLKGDIIFIIIFITNIPKIDIVTLLEMSSFFKRKIETIKTEEIYIHTNLFPMFWSAQSYKTQDTCLWCHTVGLNLKPCS